MRLCKLLLTAIVFVSLLITGCAKDTSSVLKLEFAPIENRLEFTLLSEQAIGEITSELLVDDTVAFLYTPKAEPEVLHGGIKVKDSYYDVGQISAYQQGNKVETMDLFGKKVIKFSGTLGANYSHALYIALEDSEPSVLLEVDGHQMEMDIDEDGELEVVSTWGTLANTKIYKNIGNKIMVFDVNETVNAQVVIYRSDAKVFEIYHKPNEPKYYTLSNQVLKEVPKP